MKKLICVAAIAVFMVGSAFTLLMDWKADAAASTVTWELPGKKGNFGNLNASINFDKKKLNESKISASIDVKTLKAGNEKLETHLLSPDFFDAEKFPKISFTSTEIAAKGDAYVAKGKLTMKDSTKMIEIPFTFTENGNDKATFNGTMTVMAAEYGVMKKNPDKPGSDQVMIYLTVPVGK